MQKSTPTKADHTDLSDLDLETVAAGKEIEEPGLSAYLEPRRLREYEHRRYEHRHYDRR
jgi:hypothetical protein